MLRFSAEFEMDIFWKTQSDVRKFLSRHADRMAGIPAERWGREIMKGLKRRPYKFIRLCDSYLLIPFFLKELDDLKHVNNLYDHVLKILTVIEKRLDTNKIMQSDAFVLAGLLSRIGMTTLDSRDRNKFTDRLVSEYLTRWNVNSGIIDEVLAIINTYANFYRPVGEPEFCRAVLQYSEEAVQVALEFALCVVEAEGVGEQYGEIIENNTWNLNQVLRRFNNVRLQTEGENRYMTGREIMSLLNMKPGRRVGELLEGLDMAIGTGKVNSRSGAEAWLKAQ
jgi:tRNA nucleotidyltransferase/poly(A) polymerase